jgi:hypothetical protein
MTHPEYASQVRGMGHRLQVRPCRGSGESVSTGRVPSQARGTNQQMVRT